MSGLQDRDIAGSTYSVIWSALWDDVPVFSGLSIFIVAEVGISLFKKRSFLSYLGLAA